MTGTLNQSPTTITDRPFSSTSSLSFVTSSAKYSSSLSTRSRVPERSTKIFPRHFINLSANIYLRCAVPENIHTPPTERTGISWGMGGSMRPKNLKKCMKLNWNFQRGGEVLEKIPSVGGMNIFWNYTILKKQRSYLTGKKRYIRLATIQRYSKVTSTSTELGTLQLKLARRRGQTYCTVKHQNT